MRAERLTIDILRPLFPKAAWLILTRFVAIIPNRAGPDLRLIKGTIYGGHVVMAT